MSLTNPDRKAPPGRIALAAAVTLALAVAGNLIVGFLANALFTIPVEFEPLTPLRYSIFTALGVLGGVFLFVFLLGRARRPARAFRRIAWIALVLSMLPTLGLYFSDFMPGTTLTGVIVLMVMHVVAALPTIYILPALSRAR
jgi:hypothetical protein